MDLGKYIKTCDHHHNHVKHFHHPTCSFTKSTPTHPTPQGLVSLKHRTAFYHYSFVLSTISYKRNHPVYTAFCVWFPKLSIKL